MSEVVVILRAATRNWVVVPFTVRVKNTTPPVRNMNCSKATDTHSAALRDKNNAASSGGASVL